jgi:photosystem II stability/assembly factor-like uncharacterized protein
MTAAAFIRSAFAVLALAAATAAARADWPDPALTAAETMPRASKTLLLDGTRLHTGRLVLVGERGHVLLSDDGGGSWRQVEAPTRATLTAIDGAAAGDAVVAVGHDGIVLVSADLGESWRRVREEPFSPDNFGSDSNGSPLLDVLFLDDQRVLAVGAYSLLLFSDDAGASWRTAPLERQAAVDGAAGDAAGIGEAMDAAEAAADADAATAEPADDAGGGDAMLFSEDELTLDDEVDPHLNAVVRTGAQRLLMVGERGTVFASPDDGATWQVLQLPYAGSMFGALHLGEDRVLVYGLRGNAFQSDDHGRTWRALDTGVQASLFAAALAEDGALTLAGAEGAVLHRAAGQAEFKASVFSTDSGETPVIADIVAGDAGLLLLGERGVAPWRQP